MSPQIDAAFSSVPRGRLIIVDMFAESKPLYSATESFSDHFFVWSIINDFGGRTTLHGRLPSISSGLEAVATFNSSYNTLAGIGSSHFLTIMTNADLID